MKLSKREVIMLTLLLIIGLFFIEFKLIINPGVERLTELSSKNDKLEYEIDTINLNLTIAKTNEKKRDTNLTEISTLSEAFLSGVKPDALLVFTHNLLVKHGFLPKAYSPSPLSSALLLTDEAKVTQLTYRIKQIAQEYQALGEAAKPKESSAPTSAEKTVNEVERYTLQVSAIGTYAQIKAMLDELAGMKRMIIITNINMTPENPLLGTLGIEFWINYYGIEKLQPVEDSMNKWSRAALPASTIDPYIPIAPTSTIRPPVTTTR